MKDLEEAILSELKKIDGEDLKGETGAACFKSIGFATCQDGITEKVANDIASRLNVSVTFYDSQTCSEINCKP